MFTEIGPTTEEPNAPAGGLKKGAHMPPPPHSTTPPPPRFASQPPQSTNALQSGLNERITSPLQKSTNELQNGLDNASQVDCYSGPTLSKVT